MFLNLNFFQLKIYKSANDLYHTNEFIILHLPPTPKLTTTKIWSR